MNRLGIVKLLSFVFGVGFFSQSAFAATFRVDISRPPGGNGSSWTNAYNNLATAITAAVNNPGADEIWVAEGTYKPANASSSFNLQQQLQIYGGFLGLAYGGGGESLRSQRNFASNETILSGDIGTIGDRADNCLTVVKDQSGSAAAVIDGFTIRDGVGTGGAGIEIGDGSSPTIANCRFLNNGVIDPDFESFGGAVYFNGSSAAIFVDTVFQDNRAYRGGAVWLQSASASAPTFQRCRFEKNQARVRGGAIENLNNTSLPGVQVLECWFSENIADAAPGEAIDAVKGGGAISNDGGIATVRNCVFWRNESAQNGAAVNVLSGAVTMRGCTLAENTAAWRAGGIWQQAGTMTVRNTALWANIDKDGTVASSQLTVNGGTADVKYSDIQDDAVGGSVPFGSGSPNFNIDTDPQFIDMADGNLRIKTGSGCKNSGNNSEIGGATTDIDGRTRIIDTTVDRGAHESAYLPQFDCDTNGTVDDVEIAADPSLDCNNNGVLDACELSGADCNSNDTLDSCEIASAASPDCNANGTPDDCESFWPDCNGNCIADSSETLEDCDTNGTDDVCEGAQIGRWSSRDDFLSGTFMNTEALEPAIPDPGDLGWLQRQAIESTTCLPYIWVPCTERGTVARINTETEEVIGEYKTAPENHKRLLSNGTAVDVPASSQGVTVDLDGSAWIANFGDGSQDSIDPTGGSVAKIGMVIGGTRVNEAGISDQNGEYLKPPFDYCTCEDRDGDGLIHTSQALGDILEWGNYDGADDPGANAETSGVENAEDECILRYTRLGRLQTHAIAVDRENDIWIGAMDAAGRLHEKINGFTGVKVAGASDLPPIYVPVAMRVGPTFRSCEGARSGPAGGEEAAWEAFYQWSAAQCWGNDCETTGAEQFRAMVAKLNELGLSMQQAVLP
ncbi:MAG: hypothetical protein DCC65_17520 [Planctomycetota bacterium]|nr:MAG: hypothetical protein DCC65_17520 [Planctomycetota bacterium]